MIGQSTSRRCVAFWQNGASHKCKLMTIACAIWFALYFPMLTFGGIGLAYADSGEVTRLLAASSLEAQATPAQLSGIHKYDYQYQVRGISQSPWFRYSATCPDNVIIGRSKDDYDGDGSDEVLDVLWKGGSVTLQMYEQKGNALTWASSIEDSSPVGYQRNAFEPYGNYDLDVFQKANDRCVYVQVWYDATPTASGTGAYVFKYAYESGSLVEKGRAEIQGSNMSLAAFRGEVSTLGLNVAGILLDSSGSSVWNGRRDMISDNSASSHLISRIHATVDPEITPSDIWDEARGLPNSKKDWSTEKKLGEFIVSSSQLGVVPESPSYGFDLKKDGHCIINASKCFSYDHWYKNADFFNWFAYKIPFERYQEVFGEAFTKHMYDQDVAPWRGNCFGMSVTAVLFHIGKIKYQRYTKNGASLADGGYDEIASDYLKYYPKLKKTSELTKLIERYQIWQPSLGCRRLLSMKPDAQVNGAVVADLAARNTPYAVNAWWYEGKERMGHTMVVDSVRLPVDIGGGWKRIYLYDPNHPYFGGFGDKTPDVAYKQASNRYVEVNTKTGAWRMSARINGESSELDISSSDGSSELVFLDVRDVPESFNRKAEYSPHESDSTAIEYCCDSFSVRDSYGKAVFAMLDGVVSLSSESVEQIPAIGYSEGVGASPAAGRLYLPSGKYSVTAERGKIAFMEDGDYAGVVTGGRLTVQNEDTASLSISSARNTSVNVVINDEFKLKLRDLFTSVSTDYVSDGSKVDFSLNGGELSIGSASGQMVDVESISSGGETRTINNVKMSDAKSLVVAPQEDISHAYVRVRGVYYYSGKAITAKPVVTYRQQLLREGIDYTVAFADNVNAGVAKCIVTGKGVYAGSKTGTFRIYKIENPLKVSTKTKKVKRSKAKKRRVSVKPIVVKGAVGKVTYAKSGGSKKLSVGKTGKIKVKKGTKKGKYKVSVIVKAAGNTNYKSAEKRVDVKVKVA